MADEEFWTRPLVRVRDVAASLDYYCDKLGCTRRWVHGEPLIIAEVERSGLNVILDADSVLPRPPGGSVLTLSLHQPRTLTALHGELVARGARVLSSPAPVPWQDGTHQFTVEDLDGNILVFWGEAPGAQNESG
jgi:catechol 2,3-dioxygenase-like lactoylglutathione lyase family enzyme